MKKLRTIIAALLVFSMIVVAAGCSTPSNDVSDTTDGTNTSEETAKIKVITTLFPQYDFVKQIGKDKVEVSLLLPPGVESHSYEPTPRDIVDIQKSNAFIYTGEYMEPWAHKVIETVKSEELVVIDTSAGINLMDGDGDHHDEHGDEHHDEHEDEHHDEHEDEHHDEHEEEHHDEHEEEHHDEHEEEHHDEHEEEHHDEHEEEHHDEHEDEHEEHDDHHHGGKDPHIWLDPVYAQVMVDNILEGLVKADPSNESFYRENADDYKAKLQELHEELSQTFEKTKYKKIIFGGHFAFHYFTERYGLEYISAYSGFAPDAEPTPQRIAELINNMEESGMKVIYYEELVDPKVAKVISEQTGAEMLLLHGAHNVSKEEKDSGITYIDIIKGNLENLKQGLGYEE